MRQLAYTMLPGKGDADRLLPALADQLIRTGHRVVGCVQGRADEAGMTVNILPDGTDLLISQTLGPGSNGCRMDHDALERAVATVQTAYGPTTDLLVINKFGKREAAGGGFRGLIGQAVGDGVPVLVGLNTLNLDAFKRFADGMDQEVAPNLDALMAWFQAARPIAPVLSEEYLR